MIEYNDLIEVIKAQEEAIVFDHFDSFDALAIGMILIERAKRDCLDITFNISLNRKTLFHFSMPGAVPDYDIWIIRKENSVYRTFRSSFYLEKMVEQTGIDFNEYYGLDNTYVAMGGCIPISIRGVGVVGCITVSGLKSELDHQMAIDVTMEYIWKMNNAK